MRLIKAMPKSSSTVGRLLRLGACVPDGAEVGLRVVCGAAVGAACGAAVGVGIGG